jgi:hypothetical protein
MMLEVSVGTVCVCLWLGVREEGSSGKFGGESGETFGKQGKGKEGLWGFGVYWKAKGKQNGSRLHGLCENDRKDMQKRDR